MPRAFKSVDDMDKIRRAVKSLQNKANKQFEMDQECQTTIASLKQQIQELRSAFMTLSEFVLTEVDSLRQDTTSVQSSMHACKDELTKSIKHVHHTMEVWYGTEKIRVTLCRKERERMWIKDNEILKASNVHHVEWMQHLQQESSECKDLTHALQHEMQQSDAERLDLAQSLRSENAERFEQVNARITQHVGVSQQLQHQIKLLASQRAQDLGTMEKAFGVMRQEHSKLKHNVNASMSAIERDTHQLLLRADRTDQIVRHLKSAFPAYS